MTATLVSVMEWGAEAASVERTPGADSRREWRGERIEGTACRGNSGRQRASVP
ncbi:MAG: hypothetical protein ACKN9W_00535 [Methylococcus sp.]